MQDDIYLNNVFLYSLFVSVDTPQSSSIAVNNCQSPLAALATFQGLNSDPDAPAWTRLRLRQPLLFRQPRGAMAEVFATLAFWVDNYVTVWLTLLSNNIKTNIVSFHQRSLAVEMISWAVANAVS
jgi:hypothetical protein